MKAHVFMIFINNLKKRLTVKVCILIVFSMFMTASPLSQKPPEVV